MAADVIERLRSWRLPINSRTTFLFFELLTGSGLSGIGEASMSGDDAAAMGLARGMFDELIAGRPATEVPAVLDHIQTLDSPVSLPEAAAMSGLDQCLWDLYGQASALPVHALLGGRVRDKIDLYANINRGLPGRRPEDFAERAAAAAADGFTRIKCAPFDQVRPDHGPDAVVVRAGLERLHAVRTAIGGNVDLMVDCHGRLSLETCQQILPELAQIGLSWLEDPLITHPEMNRVIGSADGTSAPTYAPHEFEDGPAIIREYGIRLAGGEFEYGAPRFKQLLAAGVLDCLTPDVRYCGGLRTGMTICDLAAQHGATIAPHNPGGPVGTLASTQLCAAADAFEVLEYQWREVTDPEAFLTPYEPRVGGRLRCSDRPGFGSSLNYEALRAYAPPIET